ncbi:MAG: hypothetical protein H7A53_11010 [Akkermansiaceae bacterium]|nr:hypothetical protein [Akkermansiaceae bacterium]
MATKTARVETRFTATVFTLKVHNLETEAAESAHSPSPEDLQPVRLFAPSLK